MNISYKQIYKQAKEIELQDPYEAIKLLKVANEIVLKNYDPSNYMLLIRLPQLLHQTGQLEIAVIEENKIKQANASFKKQKLLLQWEKLTKKYNKFYVEIKPGSLYIKCNIHKNIWGRPLEGNTENWNLYVSKLYSQEECKCWLAIPMINYNPNDAELQTTTITENSLTNSINLAIEELNLLNNTLSSSSNNFSNNIPIIKEELNEDTNLNVDTNYLVKDVAKDKVNKIKIVEPIYNSEAELSKLKDIKSILNNDLIYNHINNNTQSVANYKYYNEANKSNALLNNTINYGYTNMSNKKSSEIENSLDDIELIKKNNIRPDDHINYVPQAQVIDEYSLSKESLVESNNEVFNNSVSFNNNNKLNKLLWFIFLMLVIINFIVAKIKFF